MSKRKDSSCQWKTSCKLHNQYICRTHAIILSHISCCNEVADHDEILARFFLTSLELLPSRKFSVRLQLEVSLQSKSPYYVFLLFLFRYLLWILWSIMHLKFKKKTSHWTRNLYNKVVKQYCFNSQGLDRAFQCVSLFYFKSKRFLSLQTNLQSFFRYHSKHTPTVLMTK